MYLGLKEETLMLRGDWDIKIYSREEVGEEWETRRGREW